ncbi:CHAT domain-containing protein [Streptomyces sp. NPDC001530]|uniref:CHAT domain-containing protein n=1 Tax=Streptomyces sp. NPDC001530 TaxID=3364582 RepID=UPI00368F071A
MYEAAESGDASSLQAAIDVLQRGTRAAPTGDAYRWVYLAVLGYAFESRFRQTGRPSDIRAAIEWSEQAAAEMPTGDPQRHSVLSQLAGRYIARFKVNDDPADLDAAIEQAEQAVEATPPDDPARAPYLSNLALAHEWRFERTGDTTDQDAMIERYEQALAAPPEDTLNRPTVLGTLRYAYMDRFSRTGARKDLDTAVDRGEQALAELAPDASKRGYWSFQLGYIYEERFRLTGALDDVQAMIRHAEQALTASAPEDELWPSMLSLAARGHVGRFHRTGTPGDIDAAVRFHEAAVAALSPDNPQKAEWLSNLATDYLEQFELTGEPEALRAGIDRAELALAGIPAGHPLHASVLGNLATAHSTRHLMTGDIADLDSSIELTNRALTGLPTEGQPRMALFSNLANCYFRRYEHTGDRRDLDASIENSEQALRLTEAGDADHSACLGNLAVLYRRRHEHYGASTDLDAAIKLGEQALQALPDDHPQHASRLGNLASAYASRFGRAGDPADLDAAIDYGERGVVDLPMQQGDRGLAQVNLSARYQMKGDRADLERSIEQGTKGLAQVSADQPRWGDLMSGLARAYLARYWRSGVAADLDLAVEHIEQAEAATPPGGPGHMGLLSNLAVAYRERAALGQLPAEAVARLVESVAGPTTASPVAQVQARRNVGVLALLTGAVNEAAAMFRAAVETLPECTPRGLDWSDQFHLLGGSRGLVGDAVAAHLAIDDVPGAVELAELGRGILLSNRLDTRTDLAALQQSAPQLAAEFDHLRTALDAQSPADLDELSAAAAAQWFPERRELTDRWGQLLRRIRRLPGFSDFLAPPRIADLQRAAGSGAVVMVNVGRSSGDAVLLQPGSVRRVRLDGLTLADAQLHANALAGMADDGGPTEVTRPRTATPDLLAWLWETISEPVLTALGHHTPSPADEPLPRVWWVPTGILSLLPLHAAGLPEGPSALDCVVSSFTPTIRALLHRQQQRPTDARNQLTVAMRHTTGLPDLPGTTIEAAHLRARYPNTVGLADAQATADVVLDALPHASWVHFACHATSHPVDPSHSGLHLHDALLSIPEISRLRLQSGELAYLSACSTGQGSVIQADEAIHLASAFQLAGYRHVVATLWPVNDTVAASAARRFYRLLGNSPTADGAAAALNKVTRELRTRFPADPHLWAPFVHSGP